MSIVKHESCQSQNVCFYSVPLSRVFIFITSMVKILTDGVETPRLLNVCSLVHRLLVWQSNVCSGRDS